MADSEQMARPSEPDLVSTTLADGDRAARRWYYTLTVGVAALVCLPVWLVDYPPLVDYPNHIARCYILWPDGDVPVFRERYEFDATPIPTLAMDVVMAGLCTVVGVFTAGKVFLTLTLLLYYFGGHLLGRAIHGRPTWLALGTALFGYHSMFFYGYTNYSFSVGMFLVALAGWLVWSPQTRPATMLLMMVLACLCYFAHLVGFLMLGVALMVIGVWRGVRERRLPHYLLVAMLPLMPPVWLYVALRHGVGSEEGILWSTLNEKVIGALCLVRTYNTTLDVAYLLLLIALGVATALSMHRLRADGGVLLAGLAFVGLFLIGPKEIHGGGAPVDARFLPAAAPLLLLSLRGAMRRRRAVLLLAALIGVIGLRVGLIAVEWRPLDRELREQVELFEQLPEGASVYSIVGLADDATRRKRDRAMHHAIHYATVVRHAYAPNLLAYPGQQPIRYRQTPPSQHNSAEVFPALDSINWERLLAAYDYIWCYKIPPDYAAFLRERCTAVASNTNGVLFRVHR